MSILRLSTLSLTLAIAVMTLGYANPSFADKPGTGGCVVTAHEHCHDDGDEEPATVFVVAMLPGDMGGMDGLVTSDGACGTTKDEAGHRELDVSFPASIAEGCVTVTDVFFITGPTGGPLTLRAVELNVRSNKSDVLIFFTDMEIKDGHNTGGTYVSERLPATISRSNGSITVKVNLTGRAVEKNHQPGKGDLVGPIAIGKIVYTPE